MYRISALPCVLVLVSTLYACSTTTHHIEKETFADGWNGIPYSNLLVVGVYDDRAYRISSEIGFTDELKKKGVAASPGYEIIPQLDVLDDATELSDITSSKGYDALLTIATTDINDELTYEDTLETRGYVRLLGGRPGAGTDAGLLISYLVSGTYALHVALWDTKTQQLVWQVTTHSVMEDSPSDEIKSLADLVVQKLGTKGMINVNK